MDGSGKTYERQHGVAELGDCCRAADGVICASPIRKDLPRAKSSECRTSGGLVASCELARAKRRRGNGPTVWFERRWHKGEKEAAHGLPSL